MYMMERVAREWPEMQFDEQTGARSFWSLYTTVKRSNFTLIQWKPLVIVSRGHSMS